MRRIFRIVYEYLLKNSTYMLNKNRIVSIFGDKVDSRDPDRFCVVTKMNLPVTIVAYLKQKKFVKMDIFDWLISFRL